VPSPKKRLGRLGARLASQASALAADEEIVLLRHANEALISPSTPSPYTVPNAISGHECCAEWSFHAEFCVAIPMIPSLFGWVLSGRLTKTPGCFKPRRASFTEKKKLPSPLCRDGDTVVGAKLRPGNTAFGDAAAPLIGAWIDRSHMVSSCDTYCNLDDRLADIDSMATR